MAPDDEFPSFSLDDEEDVSQYSLTTREAIGLWKMSSGLGDKFPTKTAGLVRSLSITSDLNSFDAPLTEPKEQEPARVVGSLPIQAGNADQFFVHSTVAFSQMLLATFTNSAKPH
jgi:hypothetical protein